MRELPLHVRQAIVARDPLADVRWDDSIHCWILYWDGVRICALFHDDGNDMIEPCVDEILAIMGRYDNYNDGRERIAAMKRTAADAKAKAEKRRMQMFEDSMRETEAVTDVMLNGVSPQVHITGNPLAKKEQDSC